MDDEKNLPVESELQLPAEKTEEYPWLKMSQRAKEGLELSRKTQKTKHGLFANIPIICKSSSCPYRETCAAYAYDLAPEGEPCVIEIALITKLYEDYSKELQIDTTQIVNLGLVKQLIDSEVTIARCDAILAKDGDILRDYVTGITPQGQIVSNREAHPALAIRDKSIQQKNNALQLLNSTPKDKAKKDQLFVVDASTYASKIAKRARELKRIQEEQKQLEEKTIDVEARTREE
jgi:hypothetical protein